MKIQIEDTSPKKFVPFSVKLTFETEEEFEDLVARYNCNAESINKLSDCYKAIDSESIERIWRELEDLYNEKPYKK